MTFQDIANIIKARWTDAIVEDACILITVAAPAPGPVTVRLSYSATRDEIGFFIDLIDAPSVPDAELVAACRKLNYGNLLRMGERIALLFHLPRASFTDVDILRYVHDLVAFAAELRARWTSPRVAA